MTGRWRAMLMLLLLLPASEAASRRPKSTQHRSASISQRRRLHVNSLVNDSGTFSWEWYTEISPDGDIVIPTTWRLTPGEGDGFWSRTELSASFDALVSDHDGSSRVTQSSDHLYLAATTTLPDVGPLKLAFAPFATFWLRGDQGARLGGSLYGKLEGCQNQGGFSLSWSGATHPSPTNAPGVFDLGLGYGYRLGTHGLPRRLTLNVNGQWERSSGLPSFATIAEGLEFEISDPVTFGFGLQQTNLLNGSPVHALVLGLTWNVGRLRH